MLAGHGMVSEDQPWLMNDMPPYSLYAEHVSDYGPGGFHPVDIGNVLKERYRIVRKLGHGGSSTVWLAEITSEERYVAVKILSAAATQTSTEAAINRMVSSHEATRDHVVPLLDHFKHTGPKGIHDCLVLQPMGSAVVSYDDDDVPSHLTREIAKQLLEALQCLHDLGIIHGDAHLGIMLFCLTEPIEDQDEVEGRRIATRGEARWGMGVPKYIYEDWPLPETRGSDVPVRLKLSDLGGAFQVGSPPRELSTPVALRAPELILDCGCGTPSDVWSAGCILFEMATGRRLFFLPGDPDPNAEEATNNDSHLLQMTDTLGPLPSAMYERWPRRTRYFDADRNLMRTDVGKSESPRGELSVGDTLEELLDKHKSPRMTWNERTDLLEVLRAALRYDPASRPSAGELLRMRWFRETYSEVTGLRVGTPFLTV